VEGIVEVSGALERRKIRVGSHQTSALASFGRYKSQSYRRLLPPNEVFVKRRALKSRYLSEVFKY